MRIALISDIHSNLEAFQAVSDSIIKHRVDKVLFLGDIVGYGANPNECIELLRRTADHFLAGNHDFGAIGKTDITYFNPYAKEAVIWNGEQLTEENRIFLSSLPLLGECEGFIGVHAAPLHPEEWHYIFSVSDAHINFYHFSSTLCFIGHSHYPMIFAQERNGKVSVTRQTNISIEEGVRYIVNIGSVGQPRDENPSSSYGLYDIDKKKYHLIRVPYDITTAQQKILDAGLPRFLAARLALGK